ncbi:cation:proton antiporter [Streptomyces gamaensis]|uniref:Cation:proton antiporter n=1 Tax=Streptomyces gamaensis TaxID=1763542 RepID=A0ABW0YW15_9ACTN
MKSSPADAAVLAAIAVVLVAGVAITPLRARLRQPAVVGEIAVGVLLGPSVLGLLPGDWPGQLFPPGVREHLSVVAQVGIALFMFVAGWELDLTPLRGRARAVLAVTGASVLLPFTLALGLAAALLAARPGIVRPGVSPVLFAVFLGLVLSLSALSVLVRIVGENGLQRSRAGVMATACGALTEVVAWCAVVGVLTAVRGPVDDRLPMTFALIAGYALVMVAVVRPALRALLCRPARRQGRPAPLVLLVGSGVLLSSWCTSLLGVHAVIGAFAFGLVMPREVEPVLRETVEGPLRQAGTLLVPVFFALAGLSVDLGTLGPGGALELTACLAVAWGGKFAGAAVTGWLLNLPWREAATLGVLVTSKGLSEVVILAMGREAGLIDERAFTVLLLAALAATASVNPLVRRLLPAPPRPPDIVETVALTPAAPAYVPAQQLPVRPQPTALPAGDEGGG